MKLKLLLTIPLFTISLSINAEVTLDGTLGGSGTLPGPDYLIGADLGQQHGGNLFHSFQDFNLQSFESATFSGPDSVNNVISRITGGNPSQIDGLIRSTIFNADMYLVNPYGIMFGPNAQLDVQGSFHASTADYLRLGDGGRFDARNPGDSLLTVASVEAFGFLTSSPAALSLMGSSLSVPTSKMFSLIGGNINLNQVKVLAPAGQINLASVAQSGEVILTTEEMIAPLQGGEINLMNESKIEVSGEGNGNIFIRSGQLIADNSIIATKTTSDHSGGQVDIQADRITLTQGSRINADTEKGAGSNVFLKANEVTIRGTNDVGNKSAISLRTMEGNGGNLRIEARQFTIDEGAEILADSQEAGTAANLTLIADTIKISGFLSEQTQTENVGHMYIKSKISIGGSGKGGNLLIEANQILLENGGAIVAAVKGEGDGGTIELRAKDIQFRGNDRANHESMIDINNLHTSTGAGVHIQVETENLWLDDGAAILGFNQGQGKGSNITINAKNKVTLRGVNKNGNSSAIDTSSIINLPSMFKVETPLTAGPAGTINIEADKLVIQNGARISSSSIAPADFGSGQGGEIIIKANQIEMSGVNPYGENEDGFGSGIYTRTIGEKAGNAGKINLTANSLLMTDGAVIQSSTNNESKGGDIDIQVKDWINIKGDSALIQLQPPLVSQIGYINDFSPTSVNNSTSGIYANSNYLGSQAGNSGSVDIHTNVLQLDDGGVITANSLGTGEAGELKIQADTLQILGGSQITTSAQRAAGGNIQITSANQVYLHHGQITTSVTGGIGSGGDITVANPTFVILNQGKIKAQADEGHGGNIRIVADHFIKSFDSLISASSRLGIDGDVEIDSPNENVFEGLLTLPATPIETGTLSKKSCSVHSWEEYINRSRFNIHPIAGSPPSPYDLKPSRLSNANKTDRQSSVISEELLF